MLFTFLAVAAAPQALGLRPSATSSVMSAQFAKLRDFAKAAPSSDPTIALNEVASVVNSIMIQAGNATDHLTDDDQALLNQVIAVIRDSMYASMTTAHVSDENALAYAIDAINQCYMTFTDKTTGGGEVAVEEDIVRTHQNSLNGLQDDVDAKTELNNTYWQLLADHMTLISPAPDCEPLPHPRTMPSFDVYFESNPYVVWWNAQKLAYEPVSAAFKFADQQLRLALTAYAVGLAVRDEAYCDWKRLLDAACAEFSTCYEREKARYLNVVKPAVEEDMKMRIEAYKAGETIIHQIKFLLAEKADQATPAINTDIYQIAFPAVPAKPACDLSALDDAAWVPTPDCHDEEQLVNGCSSSRIFAQYGAERMEDGNKIAGEAVCCDASNRCTRHIRDNQAWFLTSLSHEHCTTDSTGIIVENQTPPSHSFHQAQAMCRTVGWRLPKTQAEVDSTCHTGCHGDFTLVWIDPPVSTYTVFIATMNGLNGRDAGYSSSLPAAGWTDVSDAYTVMSQWGAFQVWMKEVSGSITLPRTTKRGIVTIFVKGVALDSVTVGGIAYGKSVAASGAAFNRDRSYAFAGTLPESLQGEVLIKTPHDFEPANDVTITVSGSE